MLRTTECLRANRLGLRPIATRALSVFSDIRKVLTPPSGILFVAEAEIGNFCTHFLIVLRSGTIPCLSMLKCLNICCVGITESLFIKKVSTANARFTADH
jgi:hypothetical protein